MEIDDGPALMARDAEMLAAAEVGAKTWRVYAWDGPWVSIGRFQRPERAVPNEWERWCKRPTGGKAVLHGHDVTFAYALPLVGDARQLKPIYRQLTAPLIGALNRCGLPCALAETTVFSGPGRSNEDCFAFNSPNDIVCPETGLKVCGCALRIGERAALLQASIPFREPLIVPAEGIVGAERTEIRLWRYADFEEALGEVLTSN